MNDGDYVTGVPTSPQFRADYPTVTGTLSNVTFEFMGEEISTTHVIVKYDDGTTAEVDVDGDSLKVASPRRHESTVLKEPS